MTAWSTSGKQTAGKVGGGTAKLPPQTSYPTNRTSEKPEIVKVRFSIAQIFC